MSHPENATVEPSHVSTDAPIAVLTQKQGWRVSVSFEFDLNPVLTWRGVVYSGSAATASARGIKEARKHFKGSRPRSIAVCLEKLA